MKKSAFTLVEILIAFILMGIIASIIVVNSRFVVHKAANSHMSLAAFKLLQNGVGDYIADKGMITSPVNLCTKLAETFNVHSDIHCSQVSTTSDFSTQTPNFVLPNGLKFYNFGRNVSDSTAATLLTEINSELTAIQELDNTSDTYNEDLNSLKASIEEKNKQLAEIRPYYMVYVDIDGSSRNGTPGQDIVTFLINIYGEVLPHADLAENVQYLSAGYKYLNKSGMIPTWDWVEQGIPYKTAICKSGTKLQTKNYCGDISTDTTHCSETACKVVIINN